MKRLDQERGELKEKMNSYEVHLPNHMQHALVLLSDSQTCCGIEGVHVCHHIVATVATLPS